MLTLPGPDYCDLWLFVTFPTLQRCKHLCLYLSDDYFLTTFTIQWLLIYILLPAYSPSNLFSICHWSVLTHCPKPRSVNWKCTFTFVIIKGTGSLCHTSHTSLFQLLSCLVQMSAINVDRSHLAVLSPPISVCPSLTLFLFLSLSYGGCDENGCLIMQRGQPIKGPRPSDLRVCSEHSWRERVREGAEEGEMERNMGWGLVCGAGHLSSTYLWSRFTNYWPWQIDA